MKRPAILTFAALTAVAPAATILETHTFGGPAAAVPDGDPNGLALPLTVISEITSIESVAVNLEISGTYNGDLYAYLQHGEGFTVLVNRPGITVSNDFGYDDDGLDVRFDDAAANDIHTYQDQTDPPDTVSLTGDWQPDGRNVDPDGVLDTDPRTALFDSFAGENANGDWTLFVADLSGGDGHTVESWSVEVTGVPEPSAAVLMLAAGGLFLRRRR